MSIKFSTQDGFSAIEALLILVIVGIIGFVGWYVHNATNNTDKNLSLTNGTTVAPKKKSSAAKTVTPATSTTAATSAYLAIKEWGLNVSFADAASVTYKIMSENGQTSPDGSVQYVSGAKLYLSNSITTDTSCQDLGITINRGKPISSSSNSSTIAGYTYDVSGAPGPCSNATVNALRAKIDSQEAGSFKYTAAN